MNKRIILKLILLSLMALFTTVALMTKEEMQIDITQKLLMTLIFCASFLCYFKLFKEKQISKSTLILAFVFSLFKYCQLTKAKDSEFIYFFKYFKETPIIAGTAILGYTSLYYAIITGLYYLFEKIKSLNVNVTEKTKKVINYIFDIHPVILTAAIMFVLWLPHIIIQYPGVVAWDSDAEIAKYLWEGEVFSSHFPVFHIWLLGSVITTCKNVFENTNIGFFFFTILNVFMALGVFANTFRLMKELKTPIIFRAICLVIYAILPAFIGHIIINVKDTIYSLAIVLLTSTLIKMMVDEKKFWNDKKEWILYVLASILIILTRNNGIHIMIVASLAIFIKTIISKKAILKKLAIITVPVIISEIIIQAITIGYGVLPGEKGEMYSFFMQQSARYIYFHKDEITEEEEKILRDTLGYDEIEERYDPILADLVKDTFKDMSIDYLKVYLGQFAKHPNVYIDATLNMTYRLFVPDVIENDYQKTFESTYSGIKFEEEQIPSLTKAREILVLYYKLYGVLPITSLLSGYGTYNCLAIVIMLFLIKDKRKKELFVYIPIVATMGFLILSPVACFRYCLPIAFSMPILLAYYIKNTH